MIAGVNTYITHNMHIPTQYSQQILNILGKEAPEGGKIVGYTFLIHKYSLPMPFPDIVAYIASKNRRYTRNDWNVWPLKYQPDESTYRQLVFALKYEGINLLFFKKLFEVLKNEEILELLAIEPTGQYSRKIWFLYEWLMEKTLDIPNLTIKNYVPLIDEKLQYAISGKRSPRHRIINNLPGTRGFCPLIRKTEQLLKAQQTDWGLLNDQFTQSIHKDLIQRASAFLLLKDSKASFSIEGENPGNRRARLWGDIIGQAGNHPLNTSELHRLQENVIENSRFVNMGFRKEGGFVGVHDRTTGEPIPDHLSARWQDIDELINGMLLTEQVLNQSAFDPILSSVIIAFGFVFIHPFEDGNGRIHRYLIHHLLKRMNRSDSGFVFPISSAMLDNLSRYQKVLEHYSKPLLKWIEWKETQQYNIEILNKTADYYRYFDATIQAEFLYECVQETVETIIPHEVEYLSHYEEFKRYLDNFYEMPDKMIALLIRFLEQNNGKLSKRAREHEFAKLEPSEVLEIQNTYVAIFGDASRPHSIPTEHKM